LIYIVFRLNSEVMEDVEQAPTQVPKEIKVYFKNIFLLSR